ncbi:Rrf2 family transcriptional regulator [Bradyrhizobium tropiciagri]|uniref:Rrf2 family transcriptional regulator n=1 Tax=Bradyrhizobium tropiciagri TaxID=312253 RepID=UPI000A4EED93|nr:Rrf2 family transcriptional regulator [Bradyrhizobium tropiciagri]
MIRDSRLSSVLHGLLHMIGAGEPVTSEQLAQAMATNPVVVRRVMAGLREQGLIRSEKGHGGGWTLARDPADITLADIYRAVARRRSLRWATARKTPAAWSNRQSTTRSATPFARSKHSS